MGIMDINKNKSKNKNENKYACTVNMQIARKRLAPHKKRVSSEKNVFVTLSY